MIYSSRDILEMQSRLMAITSDQWLLLAIGLITGIAVWALFNRGIVHRIAKALTMRSVTANTIALVEGVIGGIVFLANAGIVYVATLMASFFLFAFGCVGTLMGAWMTIPASFE